MTHTSVTDPLRVALVALLTEARERTWRLVDPLGDDDLRRQHDALMSPILWDLGHIGQFEALWLTRNTRGDIAFSEMPGLYNPFEHPRAARGALPLPGLTDMRLLLDGLRDDVLATLEQLEFETTDPLLGDGFVVHMVAQHEYQHGETILQTLQLKTGQPYAAPRGWTLPEPVEGFGPEPGAMVRFPGGDVLLGTDDRRAAYDNERPAHRVVLPPFWIDAAPVRNGEYLAFLEAGGYVTSEWWSAEGWRWLQSAAVRAPRHWIREGGEWHTRTMDRVAPLDPRKPVCHVCWYEAEAYARWAGKRLPTEAEWETAVSWDPETTIPRLYPWGAEPPSRLLANLDQLAFDTAPVGAYPRNVSPIGCYGMIGDVWEWTASDFHGYPGFTPFPYPEYSQAFFGTEYKVLRGGSWATRPGAIRNTFRNWDYPIRRQIFAGFRCARDD